MPELVVKFGAVADTTKSPFERKNSFSEKNGHPLHCQFSTQTMPGRQSTAAATLLVTFQGLAKLEPSFGRELAAPFVFKRNMQ